MASISTAFEAHQIMSEKNTLIAFTGHFDHLLTTLLLLNIKNKLSALESSTGIDRKVYSILVESIENISKHSSKGDETQNIAILLLSKSEDKYTIVTGNHIMNDEIPALQEKLETVLKHNQAELKQLYREQILSKRTDDNNAGLGIIDMAIKSGNKIKYEFKKLTEDTSFYLLQIEINIQKLVLDVVEL
ncbi:MAG: SiaB family protein kinase [Bacteroidetes bacterium]|nr:SiaB family protein kinase [Bacteroidota bacterium]